MNQSNKNIHFHQYLKEITNQDYKFIENTIK